jgi:hypothetical protein
MPAQIGLSNVAREREAVRLRFDQHVLEPVLEEMPATIVVSVEALDLSPQKAMHTGRERAFRRHEREVIVIRHEAVLVENPAGAGDLLGEKIEKQLAVLVIPKDRNAVVAARHHMMERPGILDSRLPRHRTPRLPRSSRQAEEMARNSPKTSSEGKQNAEPFRMREVNRSDRRTDP